MDNERFCKFTASIQSELQNVSSTSDWLGCLSWLLDHIDCYIERWEGFYAAGVPADSLIQSDIYICIVVAANFVDQELRTASLSNALADSWHSFSSFIRNNETNTEENFTAEMIRRFDLVRSGFDTFKNR